MERGLKRTMKEYIIVPIEGMEPIVKIPIISGKIDMTIEMIKDLSKLYPGRQILVAYVEDGELTLETATRHLSIHEITHKTLLPFKKNPYII